MIPQIASKVSISPLARPSNTPDPGPTDRFTPSDPPPTKVTNFGGNQTWEARYFQPSTEDEVLAILDRARNSHIRAIGSKHSWSDTAATNDLGLNMSNFTQVEPFQANGEHFVRVGGGCQLKRLVAELEGNTDQTMPTLGAITEQTISGAISTGTHGSGKQSLSHFVAGIRVAAYDPETGKAKIFEYKDGDELKAARCGLGCMGVVLSVDLKTRDKYQVEEKVTEHTELADVMKTYDDHPLTQFTLFPHAWKYMAWERKAVEGHEMTRMEKVKASLYHAFNTVSVDVAYHAVARGLHWIGSPTLLKGFQKISPSLILKNVTHLDGATKVLTLKHQLFRHEEEEIFVPQSRLAESVDVLKYATQVFAGEHPDNPVVEDKLKSMGLLDELKANAGSYTHGYPFYFRKVLPDDTLISMAASKTEPSFSISLFNYNPPADRKEYYEYCSFMARTLNQMVGARLHWGKHFELDKTAVAAAYPELEKFKALATKTDPNGVFHNAYTERVLGLNR